jgi:signal transduction histidine kinase
VAVANAAAFGLVALVMFGMLFLVSRQRVLSQIDSDIAGDRNALLATLAEQGYAGLAAEVARRAEVARVGEAYYVLTAPDGSKLAGNLPAVQAPSGWGWARADPGTPGWPDSGLLRIRTDVLPGGGLLLVGRDPQRLDNLEDTFVGALVWTECGVLLFGLLSGYIVSRRVLRGVATIAGAAGRIGAGDLAQRIPPVGGGNEITAIGTAVNQMLDRIGALTRSLRQVTDDIAHDLRTPLSRLRQNLERAALSAESVEDVRGAVDRALAECDAIIGTFNALLRIAQIEGNDPRGGFEVVDLSGLLLRLADVYGPSAEEDGRSLRLDIAPGIGVLGDAEMLGQMAANLLENALRHTPPGASLLVALGARPSGARLIVADDGPGIPAEERARVLHRFVRLDVSRNTPGTGLGLALVKAVADAHGAVLSLQDNAPGLRVVLDFPEEAARE